jgi:hypothetical protein
MKKHLVATLALLCIGNGLAFGQQPVCPSPTTMICDPCIPEGSGPRGNDCDSCCGGINSTSICGRAEYLLWWFKDAPLPASLVTTGPVSDNPGALGHGGGALTGNRVDTSALSGMRFTAGLWLDSAQTLGLEAGGFLFPRQSRTLAFRLILATCQARQRRRFDRGGERS